MAIKYPGTIKTDDEKLEFLYRAQEKLRLDHNANGADYRDGKISPKEWFTYKYSVFAEVNQQLSQAIGPLKDAKVAAVADAKQIAIIDVDIVAIKEPLKQSSKHDAILNLAELVK